MRKKIGSLLIALTILFGSFSSYIICFPNEVQAESILGNEIARQALSKQGSRYWWGAPGGGYGDGQGSYKNANAKYFDCSGLVAWAHYQAGEDISRKTASEYSKSGKLVSYNELEVGDVITFSYNRGASVAHIGIYIGDGQMVHASGNGSTTLGNDPNQCVKIDNITPGSYFYQYIYNCRRLHSDQTIPTYNEPTLSNIVVTNVDDYGYNISATINYKENLRGVDPIIFPTWTDYNGQDDITWGKGVISGNTVTYRVNINEHNNETGNYKTRIYIYDNRGGMKEYKVEPYPIAVPEIMNIRVSDIDATGYTVTAKIRNASKVKEIRFPTWSVPGTQDDITWEEGTIVGDIVTYRVETSKYINKTGNYRTQIYVTGKNGKTNQYKVNPYPVII